MMKAEITTTPPLLGAIEAGGTKYVCAVARDPARPLEEVRFPTAAPEETVARAAEFFLEAGKRHGALAALGIGTFGPARLDPAAPDHGSILATPKPGWSQFPLLRALRARLGNALPIAFETDVNAAAVGEAVHGAGRGTKTLAYVTVGTGIGGALLHDGTLLHGRLHPEIGHFIVPDLDGPYGATAQTCPFHECCLEGRASGPAVAARWGKRGEELPADHPAWELEAKYLAVGCVQLTAAWSPDLILLGGGVPRQTGLIERIRSEFTALAGAYWDLPAPESYLQLPGLDQEAGIVGALELARRAFKESSI